MSHKIFKAILLVAVSTLLCTLLIISACMFNYFGSVQKKQLADELSIAAQGMELSGRNFLDGLNSPDYRITWVGRDGRVLFDNETDAALMENHADREEIREALESGTGSSSRYSTTLTEKTLYEAVRLKDGTVLRMSTSRMTAAALLFLMLQPILLICIFAVILSAVLGMRMADKIVEPLNDLNLEHPLENDTYEELSPLLRRIQSQQEELRQTLAGEERSRREFTANVSHELKTPLQGIIGYTDLMESGLAKPEDVPHFVAHIRKEATRLVALIEDIIRLSQLDEGTDLETEEVPLGELADEVCETLFDAASAKAVTLSRNGSDGVVTGVQRLLYEVVYNLCDNAIQYNKCGGCVEITVSEDNRSVRLEVADTGIGIPEEYRERVFERFFRVDKSRSKRSGGTGLGLSIVKHAVAYHRGTIELESEPNQGTTITVCFPKPSR